MEVCKRAFINLNVTFIVPKRFVTGVYKSWSIWKRYCIHESDYVLFVRVRREVTKASGFLCAMSQLCWVQTDVRCRCTVERENRSQKNLRALLFWKDLEELHWAWEEGNPQKHLKHTNALWYDQRKPGAMFLARVKLFLVKRRNLPSSRCIIRNNTGDFLF